MASISKEMDWEKNPKIYSSRYRMKIIEFNGRITPIILQSQNGPCPLIAICNILLLRNKMSLRMDRTQVSEWRLLKKVAESLRSLPSNDENREAITDSIDLLPDLAEGLNVDVTFTRINDVKFTREYALFDLLDIPVYHGWLIDPQDVETTNAVDKKSYDTLMGDLTDLEIRNMDGVSVKNTEKALVEHVEKEYTANEASSSAANVTEIESRPLTARQGELVREFLNNNASQLTVYGLFSLQDGVQDGELCMFFRNNHFSTMFKFEGALYLLVTDVGYINQPGVVWEKLSEVNDTVYVNKNFKIYKPEIEICTQDEENLMKKNAASLARTDHKAEACSSKSTHPSFDSPLDKIRKQLALQEKLVQRVPPASSSTGVIEEPEASLAKTDYKAVASTRISIHPSFDSPLDKVMKSLALEEKRVRKEEKEKQAASSSTGAVAGPEHENPTRPRDPPRKPSKKDKQRSKKKRCTVM